MSQGNDRTGASGLLDELDDIRSLLDDALPDDAIPVLEDAVEITETVSRPAVEGTVVDPETPPHAPEVEHIPLLQDAIAETIEDELDELDPLEADAYFPDDEEHADPLPGREPAATLGGAAFPPGATVAELLAAQELQTAVRNRIDETFERWLNDTLQQELNLLRARLLEAVRAEVHDFITDQINRTKATGKPHGE